MSGQLHRENGDGPWLTALEAVRALSILKACLESKDKSTETFKRASMAGTSIAQKQREALELIRKHLVFPLASLHMAVQKGIALDREYSEVMDDFATLQDQLYWKRTEIHSADPDDVPGLETEEASIMGEIQELEAQMEWLKGTAMPCNSEHRHLCETLYAEACEKVCKVLGVSLSDFVKRSSIGIWEPLSSMRSHEDFHYYDLVIKELTETLPVHLEQSQKDQ